MLKNDTASMFTSQMPMAEFSAARFNHEKTVRTTPRHQAHQSVDNSAMASQSDYQSVHAPVAHQRSGSAPIDAANGKAPTTSSGDGRVSVEFVLSSSSPRSPSTGDAVRLQPLANQTIEQLLASVAIERRLPPHTLQVYLKNSSTPLPLQHPSVCLVNQTIYVVHGRLHVITCCGGGRACNSSRRHHHCGE